MNTQSDIAAATTRSDRRTINPATLEKLRTTILELFSVALYQDVGIREICKKAKVSPQTVYKYFGNKEEILYACIKQDLDALNEALVTVVEGDQGKLDLIRAALETWCDFYFQNPVIARIVFLNIPQAYWVGERQFVQSALHDVLLRQTLKHQSDGELWDGIPAELLNEFLIGAGHRLMIRWLTTEQFSREDVKASFIAGALKLMAPN